MTEIYHPTTPEETPPGYDPGVKSGRSSDDARQVSVGFDRTFGPYCESCQRCHKGACRGGAR